MKNPWGDSAHVTTPPSVPVGPTGRRGVLVHLATVIGVGAGLPWLPQAVQASAPDLSRVTLRVAHYKGGWNTLLKAAGVGETPYKVDWKEFNSGVQHIEAINAGALDLGSGSEIPAVFAARTAGRVRVVAVARGDLNNQAVFAQKDANIRSIADLKGKRVGYTRATTTHYFLQKMLAEVGLSLQDIQAISLSPADGLSAFARGDFDAWAMYGYNGQIARSKYGARVVKTSLGYLSGNFLTYGNAEAIEDPLRQAALVDLLRRLRTATAWGVVNPEKWAQAQSAETRVPAEALLAMFQARSHDDQILPIDDAAIASHQDVADVFAQIKVLDAPVKVAPLWDRTLSAALRA